MNNKKNIASIIWRGFGTSTCFPIFFTKWDHISDFHLLHCTIYRSKTGFFSRTENETFSLRINLSEKWNKAKQFLSLKDYPLRYCLLHHVLNRWTPNPTLLRNGYWHRTQMICGSKTKISKQTSNSVYHSRALMAQSPLGS